MPFIQFYWKIGMRWKFLCACLGAAECGKSTILKQMRYGIKNDLHKFTYPVCITIKLPINAPQVGALPRRLLEVLRYVHIVKTIQTTGSPVHFGQNVHWCSCDYCSPLRTPAKLDSEDISHFILVLEKVQHFGSRTVQVKYKALNIS